MKLDHYQSRDAEFAGIYSYISEIIITRLIASRANIISVRAQMSIS